MATTTAKGSFQPESDVHITYEDQQRINEFARINAKHEDIKDEVKNLQNELKNLEDAVEELSAIELLALDDDEDTVTKIPNLMGELFLNLNVEDTTALLKEKKEKLEQDIENLKKQGEQVSENMSNLKTQLYAKFGTHINLEPDEE